MRVLISGFYGFGNAGDEALLSGMLRALAPYGVKAVVISSDPAGTRALHGAAAVGRGDWRGIVRELRCADLFISGGGGLLQDRTSRRSALYYLGLLALAQRMGVPTYLYGQGVGPVETAVVRAAAGLILPRAAGAGARDRRSAAEFVRLGLPPERVEVTADAAFALPPVSADESERALLAAGIDADRRWIGLAWRPPVRSRRRRPGDGFHPDLETRSGSGKTGAGPAGSPARSVAFATARWAKEIEACIAVLPMHPAMDLDEAHRIADEIAASGVHARVAGGGLDFRGVRAILAGVELVVSVRYHGLLFAASAGVPCVGIAYDPKVAALGEEFGFESLPLDAGEGEVFGAIERAYARRREFKERAQERAAILRRRAEADAARCVGAARGELP